MGMRNFDVRYYSDGELEDSSIYRTYRQEMKDRYQLLEEVHDHPDFDKNPALQRIQHETELSYIAGTFTDAEEAMICSINEMSLEDLQDHEDEGFYDIAHEIAESYTPCYYGDALLWAANYGGTFQLSDIPAEPPTLGRAAQLAIHETLRETAVDTLRNLYEELSRAENG